MKETNINKRPLYRLIVQYTAPLVPPVEIYTKSDTIRRLYHAELPVWNVEMYIITNTTSRLYHVEQLLRHVKISTKSNTTSRDRLGAGKSEVSITKEH